ncbi:MAG TPA: isoprenylcysteine carboxylmethyltransferase family protein [Thermotogota bacterium]|jgi:protein-S-isoprenylcysteine O-methyltransferase Ste14|nr:isoprenylcysteine carboxylmethyltransferase family protein [Thermotogota bacterium]NLZ13822.1 isoprenylcysteine carboxylmethyltransferase family protein [Thermotogaceae bacterium]HNR63295.1 isoprenylcysteine carboxylmethyltransferase family protein [Thermotogota bacterium]HNT95509.1 isoprenylcysteine carboxylmethyltransferase family protein [Thermotogota bacterium]
MRQKAINTMGYIVSAVSIGIFPYLVFKLDTHDSLRSLLFLGWVLLSMGAGLVVASLAAFTRNRSGGLIESGVYGIVRHPMYLGALLCFLSFFCFHPHGITLFLSLVNGVIVYGYIRQGEKQNMERFGEAYKQYMKKVPQINLLAGIYRRLKNR